jgi:hypothetical protein
MHCNFNTHECDDDTHDAQEWFIYAECDFDTLECDYECDYEYDNDTHDCDL